MKVFGSMKLSKLLALAALFALTGLTLAQNQVSTLRGDANLDTSNQAPAIPKVVNSDLRQSRNYPEQPPLIPHKIDNYQIHRGVNSCLQCHERAATGVTQAPMASVTHFMNRDGQVLAQVSPRRYFCTQCHVTQQDAKPLVGNDFVDVDTLIDTLRKGKR